MEYAKGNSCGSYNLLPDYLYKLVEANSGTLAEIETEYNGNIGNIFKYMFVAMGVSIKGFEYMRKVVVVNGTHLRGKYTRCPFDSFGERRKLPSFSVSHCHCRWKKTITCGNGSVRICKHSSKIQTTSCSFLIGIHQFITG